MRYHSFVINCILNQIIAKPKLNMSVKCGLSPPQTYSRLFRPWDGKTNQDSTITSTTMQSQQQINATPDSSKLMLDNKMNCFERISESVSIPFGHETSTKSSNIADGQTMLVNSVPQTKLDTNQVVPFQQVPGFFPTTPFFAQAQPQSSTYQDLLLPNLPFIGVDPFVMEQEYARVLAEEAQVKMMTARKQRPKKFKCPHCDVAFSNNGQLKGHIRIHTGKCFFFLDLEII